MQNSSSKNKHQQHHQQQHTDSSISSIKKEIRSIERLLRRDSGSSADSNNNAKPIPATVRVAKERQLRALKERLESRQQTSKESQVRSRFEKVKFFDRKKAARKRAKAQKILSRQGDEESGSGLLKEEEERKEAARLMLEESEKELLYIKYYPRNLKYLSLYPSKAPADADLATLIKSMQSEITLKIWEMAQNDVDGQEELKNFYWKDLNDVKIKTLKLAISPASVSSSSNSGRGSSSKDAAKNAESDSFFLSM